MRALARVSPVNSAGAGSYLVGSLGLGSASDQMRPQVRRDRRADVKRYAERHSVPNLLLRELQIGYPIFGHLLR